MPLALVSTGGGLLAALMLALLGSRLAGTSPQWRSLGLTAAAGAVVTTVAWLSRITGIPAVYAPPIISLGVFFAVAVTLWQRDREVGTVRTMVFAAILTALVFVPASALVFALWYDPFATGIGYVDLGAALPTTVAAGAGVLAVRLVDRHVPRAAARPRRPWSLLWPALALWVGSIAWLVGLELAIDHSTLLILQDAILMPFSAALAFALVERVRHRRNTLRGVALGLLTGCAAATPAAGYVIPLLAVVIALIAGALAALVPFDDEKSAARSLGGSLLIGGGLSILLLGFLAADVGFIYTGQPELAFGQALTLVLGGATGFAVAALAWLLLRPRRATR